MKHINIFLTASATLFLLFFHMLERFVSSPPQRPCFRYSVKIPAKMPRYLKESVKFPAHPWFHAVKYALNPQHSRVNSPNYPGGRGWEFQLTSALNTKQHWVTQATYQKPCQVHNWARVSREMFALVLFLLYWSEVFSRVNTVTNLGKWR